MTTEHEPPTEAELDDWEHHAGIRLPTRWATALRLIDEVRRLRKELDEGWAFQLADEMEPLLARVDEVQKLNIIYDEVISLLRRNDEAIRGLKNTLKGKLIDGKLVINTETVLADNAKVLNGEEE